MLRHGHREVIRLGARSHIPVGSGAPAQEFERIAAQYPVFRVTVLEGAHT